VDDFGNVITNIREVDLSVFKRNLLQITLKSSKLQQMVLSRTYGDVECGELVLLVGSHGYLEIALNQGSASTKFGVQAGDPVSIFRHKAVP
jgi:S-adenosylmethionine hydrolase